MSTLSGLETPCLLLDADKMERNIARMARRIGSLGCVLRPHVKTHKSVDVAHAVVAGGHTHGITVSTLKEADYFFANGFTDILYAVGIAPNKLDHVARLMARGCNLTIILDHPDMARFVVEDGEQRGAPYKVFIEIDTDGHRAGMDPRGDMLLEVGRIIEGSIGGILAGVMTHAGESYGCRTPECLIAIARQERDLCILAAERLRAQGFSCPTVSIGSTPTALAIDDLTGISEVRAGVHTFFDLVMAGVGVCETDEIAISVLSSVIGYQKDKGWVISDAGWMAMSRDRGIEGQDVDYGYGLVADIHGHPIGSMIVQSANQEHGILAAGQPSERVPYDRFSLGGLIRVLPNHACATAAQYDRYHVVRGIEVVSEWPRIGGW